MSLTIYGVAASRAFRTLWAARELGLAYDHVPHHYAGPEVKAAPYLAINPMGAVPAIVDGGFPMYESLAINLYLARKAGRLWPATIEGEGRVFQWTLFAAGEVDPVIGQWYGHTAYLPPEKRKPELAEEAAPKLRQRLGAIESALASRAWLAEREFTIGDLNLAAALFRARRMDHAARPNLARWLGDCFARPAARRAWAMRGE